MQEPLILVLAAAYVGLLFAVAYYGDERAERGRSIIGSPVVYALSLGVYCTAWTFYGSVGRAATTGVGFLPIYVGPTLVMVLGWVVLRKIVRISKYHRITSIADFIGSRYGKSARLAGLAAVVAVVGVVPYLALQLKAIATSYVALAGAPPDSPPTTAFYADPAFWTAVALAVFTILFGTRHLDATERHEGIVAAIAFESVVKLVAFLAVGIYVTFGLHDGFGDLFAQGASVPPIRDLYTMGGEGAPGAVGAYGEWFWLTALSMTAILLLPRQFQITVVENVDETHLRTASWLFPLYLLAINLFVLPIAVAGLLQFGGPEQADTFVLALPLAEGNQALAVLAFLGGLSAGTGMVIVAATALTTMICNDLVVPVLLRIPALRLAERTRLTGLILSIRRAGILGVLLLAYLYVRYVGPAYTLVSIGLISFAAVAQFAPAVLGGMYWKRGTRRGAVVGLVAGFLVWGYTLPLPSLVEPGWIPFSFVTDGPFGVALLKPYALLGMDAFSPVPHALFWSLLVNAGLYVVVSLSTRPSLMEQSQAVQFVDVFRYAGPPGGAQWRGTAPIGELRTLLRRYLGWRRADRALADYARRHGRDREDVDGRRGEAESPDASEAKDAVALLNRMETADEELVHYAEQLLAGVIGAASARVVVASIVQEKPLRIGEVMDILDEAQQVLAYSRELEHKKAALERATRELRAANDELQELDQMKDDFVSTVSHELRTPLTAIRAITEILHANPDLDADRRRDFLETITRESERLTRLVNQVLDLQRLDAGESASERSLVDLAAVAREATAAVEPQMQRRGVEVVVEIGLSVDRDGSGGSGASGGDGEPSPDGRGPHGREPDGREPDASVVGERDRLLQVVLNLLSNAATYADSAVHVRVLAASDTVTVEVADDGPGIHPSDQEAVFEKFRQARRSGPQPGSGLGLAIAQRIVDDHGGSLGVTSVLGQGATFYVHLPRGTAAVVDGDRPEEGSR